MALLLWFGNATAQPLPPQTEAKIQAILDSPKLKEAHVGLSVLDLGTVPSANAFPAKPPIGKPFRVLFEHDAGKKFMPASNMKLFTAAIALELLGKEKTFPTRVIERNQVPPREHLDYGLMGGGDPSLGDDGLRSLAQQVRQAGVTKVESLWGDGNAYGAETIYWQYPFGWTLDDTKWYYGPSISSLAYNRNQIDVTITGGTYEGAQTTAEVSPYYHLENGTLTTEKELPDHAVRVERDWGRGGKIWIFGPVPAEKKIALGLAVTEPAQWAAVHFRNHLIRSGVEVAFLGSWLPALNYSPERVEEDYAPHKIIAHHNSPQLRVLFQRLLKNSDNLYAEMLLRNASYYHDGTGGNRAGPHAHALLKKWLIKQNIDTTPLRFEDGSGLSRYNLLTPRATAELLAAINRMKDGEVIWDALPIAGKDGTLRNRMKNSPAAENVRAKTGTFSIASNLSGYVTTRAAPSGARRRLAVGLYMNFARDAQTARWAQDEIYSALADVQLERTQ